MVRIQQYYENAQHARDYVTKALETPHSNMMRDYGGLTVKSVRKARKVHNEPNLPVNGRVLFNITLTKRRKK